jgi:hypothetical protein
MDSNLFKILKLKGSTNWELWALRIEAYLVNKGLFYTTSPLNIEDLMLDADRERAKIDYKAHSIRGAAIIKLALEDGPLIYIKGLNTALEV